MKKLLLLSSLSVVTTASFALDFNVTNSKVSSSMPIDSSVRVFEDRPWVSLLVKGFELDGPSTSGSNRPSEGSIAWDFDWTSKPPTNRVALQIFGRFVRLGDSPVPTPDGNIVASEYVYDTSGATSVLVGSTALITGVQAGPLGGFEADTQFDLIPSSSKGHTSKDMYFRANHGRMVIDEIRQCYLNVPEPSSLLVFGIGTIAVRLRRRK